MPDATSSFRLFWLEQESERSRAELHPGSAVLDVPSAFVYMAKTVREHKFQPHVYWLGMKEGIVSLVWNDRLKSKVLMGSGLRFACFATECRKPRQPTSSFSTQYGK